MDYGIHRELVEKTPISKETSTEKEIIIKLPSPKSEVNRMILLENAARFSIVVKITFTERQLIE